MMAFPSPLMGFHPEMSLTEASRPLRLRYPARRRKNLWGGEAVWQGKGDVSLKLCPEAVSSQKLFPGYRGSFQTYVSIITKFPLGKWERVLNFWTVTGGKKLGLFSWFSSAFRIK